MKLEVGKTYRARNGDQIKIVSRNSFLENYPFVGSNGATYTNDGFGWIGQQRFYDLIAEWPTETTGPVRTVTRKEIVFGVHGDVEIVEDDTYQGGIGIYINATMDAARIRAAANNMLAVADALEDGQ